MTTTGCSNSDAGARGSALPILLLALTGFVLITTEFLIIGLIPPLADDLRITTAEAGWLVSLFAFTVTICGPFLTARLAHVDRKNLFVCILAIFAVSNLLAALAPNVWILAVARFVPALALPVFWGTASETAASLSEPQHAGRAVSRVYLGISAALVFGVPLGTMAATSVGWRGSFAILAGLSLLLALLTSLAMPCLPASPREAPGRYQSDILTRPHFLLQVGLSVLVFTAMFTGYTYLAEILMTVAGIEPSRIGWWLMGFGLVGLFGNWFGGLAADRNAVLSTLVFALLLAAAMLLVTPAAGNSLMLVAVLAVWGISYTGLFPICQIRVMNAGTEAPALAATVNVSAANAGAGIGAIVGGAVIDHWQVTNLGYASAALGLVAVACALAIFAAAPRQSAR